MSNDHDLDDEDIAEALLALAQQILQGHGCAHNLARQLLLTTDAYVGEHRAHADHEPTMAVLVYAAEMHASVMRRALRDMGAPREVVKEIRKRASDCAQREYVNSGFAAAILERNEGEADALTDALHTSPIFPMPGPTEEC